MTMNFPTINLVATGQNIVRLRKAAGLSVKDLQDIFGFATPQAIYKWQKGTAMPTIDNLVVLAMVFQVKMDDIIVVDAAADLMDVLMRRPFKPEILGSSPVGTTLAPSSNGEDIGLSSRKCRVQVPQGSRWPSYNGSTADCGSADGGSTPPGHPTDGYA